MVVSKAKLKEYARDKLKMRVSGDALELLKHGVDEHDVAESLLTIAAKGAKAQKKATIMKVHVELALEGYKQGKK